MLCSIFVLGFFLLFMSLPGNFFFLIFYFFSRLSRTGLINSYKKRQNMKRYVTFYEDSPRGRSSMYNNITEVDTFFAIIDGYSSLRYLPLDTLIAPFFLKHNFYLFNFFESNCISHSFFLFLRHFTRRRCNINLINRDDHPSPKILRYLVAPYDSGILP